MPKVRASSGTIGTTWRPISLSLSSCVSICTNTMVVDTSRLTPAKKLFHRPSPPGTASGSRRTRRLRTGPPSDRRRPRRHPPPGQCPAKRPPPLQQVLDLLAVVRRPVERRLVEVRVAHRDLET